MSFSLHSSTENLGGGPQVLVVGSNSSSSWSVSLKSLIGLMSRKVSARPWLRNQSKTVALDGDEVRELEGLGEVARTNTVPG